jgi:hypothetical protein
MYKEIPVPHKIMSNRPLSGSTILRRQYYKITPEGDTPCGIADFKVGDKGYFVNYDTGAFECSIPFIVATTFGNHPRHGEKSGTVMRSIDVIGLDEEEFLDVC